MHLTNKDSVQTLYFFHRSIFILRCVIKERYPQKKFTITMTLKTEGPIILLSVIHLIVATLYLIPSVQLIQHFPENISGNESTQLQVLALLWIILLGSTLTIVSCILLQLGLLRVSLLFQENNDITKI